MAVSKIETAIFILLYIVRRKYFVARKLYYHGFLRSAPTSVLRFFFDSAYQTSLRNAKYMAVFFLPTRHSYGMKPEY